MIHTPQFNRTRLSVLTFAVLALTATACGSSNMLSETDVGGPPAPPQTEDLMVPAESTDDEAELSPVDVLPSDPASPDGASTADTASTSTSEEVTAPTLPADTTASEPPLSGGVVRLITHDSFAVSDGIIEAFENSSGIDVQRLVGEDTGSVLSQLILSKDNPVADVVFGIDNTYLQQALEEELFVPYRSPALSSVPEELQLDTAARVTPVDYGDVCVNYHKDSLSGPPPASLEDLIGYADDFVTQNPETSSPGLAFFFATVAYFGEDGWEDFWQSLRDGGVTVTSGWSEAYYSEFAAGEGERALVTSYATSPVAEVIYADPPVDSPPTGVLTEGCFRQIEFAGILAGTSNLPGAQALIDFLLSDEFQEDIPLNMFVFPASSTAKIPPEFIEHASVVENPLSLPPEVIAERKAEWTARWVEIVLR